MAPTVAKAAPPGSGIPPKPQSIPPNQTLYVRGVPSAKIQKEDLRTALYLLFSTYGPVLDVVALKTQSMRGQAHIVYRDIQTATQAMRALDGFNFLGHEIVGCLHVLYGLFFLGYNAKLCNRKYHTRSPSQM
jgi:U2 small nuclear ribonucleoprotein B''